MHTDTHTYNTHLRLFNGEDDRSNCTRNGFQCTRRSICCCCSIFDVNDRLILFLLISSFLSIDNFVEQNNDEKFLESSTVIQNRLFKEFVDVDNDDDCDAASIISDIFFSKIFIKIDKS